MIIQMIHGQGFAPSTKVNLDPQQLSLDNAYVTIQDDSLKGAQIKFDHCHIKLNNDIELDQIIGNGNYIVPKDEPAKLITLLDKLMNTALNNHLKAEESKDWTDYHYYSGQKDAFAEIKRFLENTN